MTRQSTSHLRRTARGLRSTRLRAVLSLGVVLGLGTVGTLAYWTDSATLTGGTFTAGTLDIAIDGAAPGEFDTSFALDNMEPGDSKSAQVTVVNAGTIPLTYTAKGRAPGLLAPSLTFSVYPGGSLSSGGDCTGTATFDSGALTDTYVTVSGDNRPIAVGGQEKFCVTATMPTGTTSGQGLSTTAEFGFDAKQVGAP